MKTAKISMGSRTFDIFNLIFMVFICIIMVYPFYNILILSFNDPADAARGGIYFFPRILSLQNYQILLRNDEIPLAFVVTVARTILGTFLSLFFTAAFAYGVSKKYLLGRKYITSFTLLTMYFSGGLIPYYILVAKWLHLKGSFLAFIFPLMFSAYNAIIMMSFFRNISPEIEESAKIDGANDLIIFIKLILPISKPVLATIALFNGVIHWNSWFDAQLFGNAHLQTLQQFMLKTINQNANIGIAAQNLGLRPVTSESLKLATMIITTLPILFSYPFLQKYFVKGIMIGSVKG